MMSICYLVGTSSELQIRCATSCHDQEPACLSCKSCLLALVAVRTVPFDRVTAEITPGLAVHSVELTQGWSQYQEPAEPDDSCLFQPSSHRPTYIGQAQQSYWVDIPHAVKAKPCGCLLSGGMRAARSSCRNAWTCGSVSSGATWSFSHTQLPTGTSG